ncbi:hypothetical protein P3T36_003044 [Kitasatospora sp. MAP12-15]|uniref:hypothetical protein n=1 Tax=unclassified Kitasatospora TaxID=2633591 RepID=UPI00247632EB|nr:hypothetical protein [Kitasatospora sp. MAP12-44]MDH6110675.1 hypothetical protein [Kitasatospora sp. MAP12-44]
MSPLHRILGTAVVAATLLLTGTVSAAAATPATATTPATGDYIGDGAGRLINAAVAAATSDAYYDASLQGFSQSQCQLVGTPQVSNGIPPNARRYMPRAGMWYAEVEIVCNS